MGFSCYEIENYIFEFVNNERKKEGLNILRFNSRLKDIANDHSHTMANAGHIWHGDGVHQAGGTSGENVALMHSGMVRGFNHELKSAKDIAWALHTSWMNSSGHRANILSSDFSNLGIAVVNRGSGYYATQLFNSGFLPFSIPIPVINFVAWWIIFTLGIFLSGLLLEYVKLSDLLLVSVFSGIVIEIISKIYQIIRFNNTFKIDKGFVLWIFIHSFLFYLTTVLIGTLELFWFGFIFAVTVHLIWKLNKFYKFKEFLSWWSTYTIGLIVVNYTWNLFLSNNLLLVSLISGLLIESVSKISQLLRKGSTFALDKWFLFWVLIFSIIYAIIIHMSVTFNLPVIMITALIVTLIVYGIWAIDFYKKKVWIWVILLIGLLILITNYSYLKSLFIAL